MTPQKRIALCLLLEKMRTNPEYSQKLGLENRSRLHTEQK